MNNKYKIAREVLDEWYACKDKETIYFSQWIEEKAKNDTKDSLDNLMGNPLETLDALSITK